MQALGALLLQTKQLRVNPFYIKRLLTFEEDFMAKIHLKTSTLNISLYLCLLSIHHMTDIQRYYQFSLSNSLM